MSVSCSDRNSDFEIVMLLVKSLVDGTVVKKLGEKTLFGIFHEM